MTKKSLYSLWGVLFIICAALGFIPIPNPGVQVVMRVLSILFFLPPAVLLWQAAKQSDRDTLKLLRNLSLGSLGLTLILLILNVLCAVASETLGNILHAILIIISCPMVCSGYWVLSLFLWACLLMASLQLLSKK